MMARMRSSIQRFEDLAVWQASRELIKGVYRATRSQELRGDRGLVDQITRAAVSVASNIAEGHERGSRRQYIEFCVIAKGSAGEVRSQVIHAHDVGLLDDGAYEWLHAKCLEVSRMLAGYLKHLIETASTVPGMKFTREADRHRSSWSEFLREHGIKQLANGQCVSMGVKEEDETGSVKNGEPEA